MRDRILRVVLAFLGGSIIAVVVTVVHGESFPWVLAGGLTVVAAYLVALRLLSDFRPITVAGALGVLVTVLVLSQRSTGGSVLIAANDAGNLWVIGSSLMCGLASAWPHLPARSAR